MRNGRGFSLPTGPKTSNLALIGEALGQEEFFQGAPFVGPSGALLDKSLQQAGLARDEVYVSNVVRCQPPENKLRGASYEREAISHCTSNYLNPELRQLGNLNGLVAIGAVASRTLLDLNFYPNIEHWHGTVNETPLGRVVPTFHPAYLLRGNQKLTGVLIHDLMVAKKVASGLWQPEPIQTIVDPSTQWFHNWVVDTLANPSAWLSVDIETPYKSGRDEGELDDIYDEIIRINFSTNKDIGITVPWTGLYKQAALQLLRGSNPKILWNERFDIPRLVAQGAAIGGRVYDFMLGWHRLQSSLPMSLGFVAPFYSNYGAWKHLSGPKPGEYAALDAAQTLRCAFGIAKDLKDNGLEKAFYEHTVKLDEKVLHPAEKVGLLVDRKRLEEFKEELVTRKTTLDNSIQERVPSNVLKEKIWKRKPADEEAVEVTRKSLTKLCTSCDAVDVSVKHKCKDKSLSPDVVMGEADVVRWVKAEPFNPNSTLDILNYISYKGQTGGKGKKKKTSTPSTDKEALQKLYKSTKDPFYKELLEYRAIDKVLGTYVEGVLKRLDINDRVHASFLHKPSTGRLSCSNPNLQNIISRDAGDEPLAAGFRKAIIAADGCKLVEADFSGIEAVITGRIIGDPTYIRLARLGVHAYLATHLEGKPADLRDTDANLRAIFSEVKRANRGGVYDRAKRCVHGTNYGLTPYGMVNNYPDDFTLATAKATQEMYFRLCPKLKEFHDSVRLRAAKQKFLGGSEHPYGYIHWFWDVLSTDPRTGNLRLGEDSKKVIAFYPQSTAAGVLYEASLELTNEASEHYIGDYFFGETPLRAPIHDSLLAEVPEDKLDDYIEHIRAVMEKPIEALHLPPEWQMGEYLQIGCDIKVGSNWGEMK
jgi:uracil-DNA glycosylase family 4